VNSPSDAAADALRAWLERWQALQAVLRPLPTELGRRLRTVAAHGAHGGLSPQIEGSVRPDLDGLPVQALESAQAVADAVDELARRWPPERPLPVDDQLLAALPSLQALQLRRGQRLDPLAAAQLLARVALDAPRAGRELRKPLRQLALGASEPALVADSASVALTAMGGLWASGGDPTRDDRLLYRLDVLLARCPSSPPSLTIRALATQRELRRELLTKPARGAARDRRRAAALWAWLARAEQLEPEELELIAGLAADGAVSVWTLGAQARGFAARRDPELLRLLEHETAEGASPRRRRRACCALAVALDPADPEQRVRLTTLCGQRDVWARAAMAANLDALADDPARFDALCELLLDERCPVAVLGPAAVALERLTLAEHPRALPLAARLAARAERWELTELRDASPRGRVNDALALYELSDSGTDDENLTVGRRAALACLGELGQVDSTLLEALLGQLRTQVAALRELDSSAPLAEQARALYGLDDGLAELYEHDQLFALLRSSDGPGRRALSAELEHLRATTRSALIDALATLPADDPRRALVVRGLGRALDARQSHAGTLAARLDEDLARPPAQRFAGLGALLARGAWDDSVAWRGLVEACAPALAAWPHEASAGEPLAATLVALIARLPADRITRLIAEQPRLPRAEALARFAERTTQADPEALLAALAPLAGALPAGPTELALASLARCAPKLLDPALLLPDRLAALRELLAALGQLLTAIDDPLAEPSAALLTILGELERARELLASLDDPLVGAERVDAVEEQLLQAAHAVETCSGRLPLAWLLRRCAGPFAAQARQAGARTMVRGDAAEKEAPSSRPSTRRLRGPAKDDGPGPADGAPDEPEAIRPTAPALDRVALPDGAAASLSDDYELLRPLGAGGLGMVFEARQRALDRPVAIKFLHPQLARDPQHRQRFTREAQLMARWAHPHIVRVIDFRDELEHPALVLELIDGRSLAEVRQRPPIEELSTVRQIAAALAYAHGHGVIHRDVCPDNVLLRSDGEALLADFGIAAPTELPRITEGGAVLGRPLYMSPEQLDGQPPTTAMDLYALGLLTYERLCGVAPFRCQTVAELAALKLSQRYTRLRSAQPTLPAALDSLVHALLAPEAVLRPSAAELEIELGMLIAELTAEDGDAATEEPQRS
jgi:hypothetical protein